MSNQQHIATLRIIKTGVGIAQYALKSVMSQRHFVADSPLYMAMIHSESSLANLAQEVATQLEKEGEDVVW